MKLNIKGFEVLIDDEDFILIKNYKWNIIPSVNTNYASAYIKGSYATGKRERIFLHRLIMGAEREDPKIDHENRNGLDCRRKNLRFITNSGNGRNRKSCTKIGIKGAYKCRNKFFSQIRINKKDKYLGIFDTAEEAGAAYPRGI